jgi:hypothetical protein
MRWLGALAVLVTLPVAACGTQGSAGGHDCPLACAQCALVTIQLSCPAAVTHAELTGPCATAADAGVEFVESVDAGAVNIPACAAGLGFTCAPLTKTPFSDCDRVYLSATGAGTCHIALDFSDGYTFSADVDWQDHAEGCGCPDLLLPSQNTLVVQNPSSSCVATDAGG